MLVRFHPGLQNPWKFGGAAEKNARFRSATGTRILARRNARFRRQNARYGGVPLRHAAPGNYPGGPPGDGSRSPGNLLRASTRKTQARATREYSGPPG